MRKNVVGIHTKYIHSKCDCALLSVSMKTLLLKTMIWIQKRRDMRESIHHYHSQINTRGLRNSDIFYNNLLIQENLLEDYQ